MSVQTSVVLDDSLLLIEDHKLAGVHEILVNDYAGHPFQIELSRTLAGLGYSVNHAYCNTNVTPRGALDETDDGPRIFGISTGDGFEKYNISRRLVAEFLYGAKSVRLMATKRPDVCLNSNVPIISLAMITVAARLLGARNVLWLQDFQAGLVVMSAGERHPAAIISRWVENWCIRRADHVVAISDGFAREVGSIRKSSEHVSTIPNWAPIEDLPVLPKRNSWSIENGYADRRVFLYSGTLGMKHRPSALTELALRLEKVDPEAVLLVVSESVGVDWIEEQRSPDQPLANLEILPFQPFDDLPAVMGTADVLIALLEPDAGEFSVPSKVLSYLCSGRPVLGLMPLRNAAAQLIDDQASAGLVAEDIDGFLKSGEFLAENAELRAAMGRRGRRYAEHAFDANAIASRFLTHLQNKEERQEQ